MPALPLAVHERSISLVENAVALRFEGGSIAALARATLRLSTVKASPDAALSWMTRNWSLSPLDFAV